MVDSKYSPIDCGDYDYLEIACMDRYDVEVSTRGESFHGIAANIEIIASEEFLTLDTGNSSNTSIRVDLIDHLRVKSRPCRFQERTFGRNATNP